MKIYHQQAANKIDFDQCLEFIFGENNIYHQVGIAYLHYERTVEKDVAVAANRVLVNGDDIRLVKKAFAFCFEECRLITTGCSNIEQR